MIAITPLTVHIIQNQILYLLSPDAATMWRLFNLLTLFSSFSIVTAQLTDKRRFFQNGDVQNSDKAPTFRPEEFRHGGYAVIAPGGRSIKQGGDVASSNGKAFGNVKNLRKVGKISKKENDLRKIKNSAAPGRVDSSQGLFNSAGKRSGLYLDEGWSGREGGFQLPPGSFNPEGGFIRRIQGERASPGREKDEQNLDCYPDPRAKPGAREINLTCTCIRYP